MASNSTRSPNRRSPTSAVLRELADQGGRQSPRSPEALTAGDAELKLLGLLEPGDEPCRHGHGRHGGRRCVTTTRRKKELFLLGDAVPAGPALTEFVLSHELDHALEDQAFGLPNSGGRSDDKALAHTAFVEGSATALMTEYAREHLSSIDLLDESTGIEDSSADLPHIALAQVMFSYFDGQRFIEELLRSAEGRWDLVDFAYERRLPETTEQILHPEKYLDDEGPLPVAGPPDAGPGWTEIDSGTVGEFMTREILRQYATDVGADAGAAGWGGDRYRLFSPKGAPAECADECRSDHALAIEWRGDDADEAAELRKALEGYVERALGGTAVGSRVWELEDGWAVIEGIGDRTTLALAPVEALARSLARPVG